MLSQWMSSLAKLRARRRIGRVTFTELSALDDRDLADLGLTRSDLPRVASSAAESAL